jgi:hypothetical protein
VGSGIMGERLAPQSAVALLPSSLDWRRVLALILCFEKYPRNIQSCSYVLGVALQ